MPAPDPALLMRLHVDALFTRDDEGRLLAVNEAGGGPAPRFFLGRWAGGARCWFRHDLDDGLVRALRALTLELPENAPTGPDPEAVAPLLKLLDRAVPIEAVWSGPAFYVPERASDDPRTIDVTSANAGVLSPYFEDWLPDVELGVPFVAVVEEGRAVSICCSVRLTGSAHEAGVETATEHRGRGLAGPAVRAWARRIHDDGLVPLYSTSWENRASRAVARRLRLIRYGADFHVR